MSTAPINYFTPRDHAYIAPARGLFDSDCWMERSSVPKLSTTMTRILALSVNGAVWPALRVRHATLCSPVLIVCRAGLARAHVTSKRGVGNRTRTRPEVGEGTSFVPNVPNERVPFLWALRHALFHGHTSTSFISALGHPKVRPRYRIRTNTDPEITYWPWHREGGSWGTFYPPIAPEWQHANRSSGCRQRPSRQPTLGMALSGVRSRWPPSKGRRLTEYRPRL